MENFFKQGFIPKAERKISIREKGEIDPQSMNSKD